jgi:hypothetical protein
MVTEAGSNNETHVRNLRTLHKQASSIALDEKKVLLSKQPSLGQALPVGEQSFGLSFLIRSLETIIRRHVNLHRKFLHKGC